MAANMVKAQPAFKPTWHGFLDTTKDAMTIVEAALQGRLSHISRRPHDKERAEMLTSGTILVYEENASGIKRWTDAVHWSPSRVMNNCLIYRQLVRALKPEEKRAALNPSCGSKRKRKESASPSMDKAGENIHNAEDEYEHSAINGTTDDATSTESFGKVYANFAQSLTPDQQRRFCGSLIDSYEFKEGGLMKKTISVKYQGTHHHIISYYSLEDVVNGKLKRPFQDQKLADIRPRPELLNGWKVSLEDEESKEMPLVASYSQHIQPSHIQHAAVSAVSHGMPTQALMQTHAPLHLQIPTEYWQGTHVQQHYTPTHHTPQHYTPPQHTASPYAQQASQQYPASQPSIGQYNAQHHSGHQYPQQSSPNHYSNQPPQPQQYAPNPTQVPAPAPAHQFAPPPQAPQQYPSMAPAQQYPEQHAVAQFSEQQHPPPPAAPSVQYAVPQAQSFDMSMPVSQTHTPVQSSTQSPQPAHDAHRRASAPTAMQTHAQPQPPPQPYQTDVQPETYYVPDQKYPTSGYSGYGY
jgi:hypothetical protein